MLHLQGLREHPAWKHYKALLERVCQADYDQLSAGLDHDKYLFQCGAYQASRRALDLMDTLIAKREESLDRTQRARATERDNRDAITYGTNLWESWQRERNGPRA